MATTVDAVQLALEQTPRYEGAVTTTPYQVSTDVHYIPIQSAKMDPNPAYMDRADELRGIEGGVTQLIDGYAPSGSIAVRGYLNTLTWLLSAAGLKGTFTAGNGVITDPNAVVIPAGVSRWVFTKRTGLTAKTLQMLLLYASASIFVKAQGVEVTRLAGDAAAGIQADLASLVYARTADPNLTPAVQASSVLPLRRRDLTLTWLGSSGVTDDFTWEIANPASPRSTFSLATPSFYPDVMEQGDAKVRMTGTIPKSSLVSADIDALLAASSFVAKAQWITTNVIASAYPYQMFIEMPKCQIIGGSTDEIANRRRFGGSYNWWAAWDEAAGYDFKITLLNTVTSIDAPGAFGT